MAPYYRRGPKKYTVTVQCMAERFGGLGKVDGITASYEEVKLNTKAIYNMLSCIIKCLHGLMYLLTVELAGRRDSFPSISCTIDI